VPAILGLMHMLREREVTLGHLGGGLAMLGALAAVGSVAIGFVVWQMAVPGADAAQMTALMDRVNDTAGSSVPFTIAVFALPAGIVALCLGLVRGHFVHAGVAGCLALGAIAAAIGFAAATMWLLIAGYAAMMVGLGVIGQMVLNETVEDWEHTPTFRGFRPAAGAS
jgi:hypothetical protein